MTNEDFLEESKDYIEKEFEEITRIKNILLEILSDFHEICINEGLTYNIGYGTLLGFVRDKGIIPWDYDIDVWMPIEDARQLAKLIKEKYSDIFVFVNSDSSKDFKYFQMRLSRKDCDIRNVHLDIFYLVGVDSLNPQKTENEYKKLIFQRKAKVISSTLQNDYRGNIGLILRKIFWNYRASFRSLKTIEKKFDKLSKKYPYQTSETVFTVFAKGKTIKKEYIEPVKIFNLNGKNYYFPNDEITILKNDYRDYKEYLPIENRFAEVYDRIVKNSTSSNRFKNIDYRS